MTDIKIEVLNYIKKNDGTSYVELERLFDSLNFNWRGEYEIYSNQCENVVFWNGWNEAAMNLINELLHDKLIFKEPAQPLIYLIDGKSLTLPLVKSIIQYKKPHWLPVVFTTINRSKKI